MIYLKKMYSFFGFLFLKYFFRNSFLLNISIFENISDLIYNK